MNPFSGYEKMPSSIKKLGLKDGDFAHLEKVKWVVTEKVHGANFSFIYEAGSLKYAKRKEYLSWSDDFFGFQLVASNLEQHLIPLFEELSTHISGTKFQVYGELFGGSYPHPDVEDVPHLHAIQTGVYYAPDVHFCAFDIAVETENSRKYLDYETAICYFEKHNIFFAKPLFIGKFGEATGFNTRINSTVPKQLSLPELSENLIEGVVIKPFDLKDDQLLSTRPILKLKNQEFDEEDKFHAAKKWTYIPNVSSKSEDLSYILEELRNYITLNRLESAISKIGGLDFESPTRVEEIQAECLRDALADFNENNDDLLYELASDEQQWISDRVAADVQKIVNAQKRK